MAANMCLSFPSLPSLFSCFLLEPRERTSDFEGAGARNATESTRLLQAASVANGGNTGEIPTLPSPIWSTLGACWPGRPWLGKTSPVKHEAPPPLGIPTELWLKVSSYLSFAEAVNLSRASSYFHRTVDLKKFGIDEQRAGIFELELQLDNAGLYACKGCARLQPSADFCRRSLRADLAKHGAARHRKDRVCLECGIDLPVEEGGFKPGRIVEIFTPYRRGNHGGWKKARGRAASTATGCAGSASGSTVTAINNDSNGCSDPSGYWQKMIYHPCPSGWRSRRPELSRSTSSSGNGGGGGSARTGTTPNGVSASPVLVRADRYCRECDTCDVCRSDWTSRQQFEGRELCSACSAYRAATVDRDNEVLGMADEFRAAEEDWRRVNF